MNTLIFSDSYEDVDGNNKKLYLLTQKNPVMPIVTRQIIVPTYCKFTAE